MPRLLECSNATLSYFSPLFVCQDTLYGHSVDLSSQLHKMLLLGCLFFLFFLNNFFHFSESFKQKFKLWFVFLDTCQHRNHLRSCKDWQDLKKESGLKQYVCASQNRRAGWLQVTCKKTSITLIPSSTRQCHETLTALASYKCRAEEHFTGLGS